MHHQAFSYNFDLAVSTSQLTDLFRTRRIQDHVIVYRAKRQQQGGGFGNPSSHPFTWALAVYVDDQLTAVNSARGKVREWNSLDRLEKWLRSYGFRRWKVINDLDEVKLTDNPEAPSSV